MDLISSIITSPQTGVSLEKELELLKSAYLFSDKISITSPSITSILMILRLANLTEKEKIEYLIGMTEVDPSLKGHEYQKAIKHKNYLERKKFKSKDEVVELGKIKHHLTNMDKYFEEWGSKLFLESGMPEFIHLIEDGIIELNHVDVNEFESSMAQQILDQTVELISTDGIYPLFDRLTEDLADAFMRENNLHNPNLNLKESFIGKEFVLSLPNIETLTFEDISNLKGELQTEFDRFRGLIFNSAKEIEGIPYSTDNRSRIEKTLKYEISPQLTELQSSIENNKFVKNLFQEIVGNIGKYSLFLGVSTLTTLENALFGVSGVGFSLTEASFKSFQKTKEQKEKLRNNSLYFYHKLKK